MDIKYSEDYKTNVFVPVYKNKYSEEIQSVFDEIKFYEKKALDLRRELGLYANIYVMVTHPIITNKIAQTGKLIQYTVADKKGKRKIGIIEQITHLKDGEIYNEFDVSQLPKAPYAPYIRLKVLVLDEDTVAMVTGIAL